MSYTSLYPTLTINNTKSYSAGSSNAGSVCTETYYCGIGLCCAYLYNSNANCS